MSFFTQLAQFICTRHYKESIYAMIGSFLDESFDMRRSGVFVVGGLLGRGTAIFELERRWEALLSRPDIGIKYFKASHCERGKEEFSKFVSDPNNITPEERCKLDSVSHEFLNAIVRMPFEPTSYLIAAGVGVVQEDFYNVIKDANARAILGGDPYRLAYDLAMIQCAWAMKQLGTGDSVSFVCDECEQHSRLAHEAYMALKARNPNAAEYMATYSSADEKKCHPLQAADAVVFEIRRALNLALGQWKGELRRQFNMLAGAKTMFIITHTNREQLLHIVSTHKPGEPFKLDEVMEQAFSENIDFRI